MVKKGFSLAEALVVMAIISIFFAAASKIITTKPKPRKQVNAHGYYECFQNGGTLAQRYYKDGITTNTETVAQCVFQPPPGIAFFNINSYGSVYHSSFEPNISNAITINFSASNVQLSSSTGTLALSSNSTESDIRMFISTLYPGSKMYNGGAIRRGVLISW